MNAAPIRQRLPQCALHPSTVAREASSLHQQLHSNSEVDGAASRSGFQVSQSQRDSYERGTRGLECPQARYKVQADSRYLRCRSSDGLATLPSLLVCGLSGLFGALKFADFVNIGGLPENRITQIYGLHIGGSLVRNPKPVETRFFGSWSSLGILDFQPIPEQVKIGTVRSRTETVFIQTARMLGIRGPDTSHQMSLEHPYGENVANREGGQVHVRWDSHRDTHREIHHLWREICGPKVGPTFGEQDGEWRQ